MTTLTRAEIVELIKRVQSGEGGSEALEGIARATGNPNVWIIFDALELEGMLPEKIFDLICGNHELQGKAA